VISVSDLATALEKIWVLICWTNGIRKPPLTAMQGAEILFYPTASLHPDEKAEHGHAQHAAWETIQRAHAIANGVTWLCRTALATKTRGDGIEFWAKVLSPALGEIVQSERCSRGGPRGPCRSQQS